jgi:hypothetical protein
MRIIAVLLAVHALHAVEYHVAVDGKDAGTGSSASPLRSIQAAADRAKAGDLVTVHAGIWRETVVPANSGEVGRPITFQAAQGEVVVIDGTEPVAGWKAWKDGIEQAPMAGDWFSRATPGDGVNLYDPQVHNQADQILVDGMMMQIARWPDSRTLDPSFPAKAVCEKFLGKSRDQATNWTTGSFLDEQFDLPASAAVGAQVMIQPNWEAWAWLLTGRITAVDGKRFTFASRSDAGKDFKQDLMDDRSRYYLFDTLGLLNAAGEWYHDKPAGRLYLKSPDGKPLEGRVSAKKREFAFDLSNRSFITIRGFSLVACTITTDRDSGGDNIGHDESGKVRYPWRNSAHKLPMEPFHQIDAYRDAPSQGVVLEGLDARYLSHFTDVSGHFFGQWGQSSGIILAGRNHRIADCRIRFSAGNGISLVGREHRVVGNLIEDTGYAANDCGAIHTGITDRGSSDHEIAWNTIRRTGRSAILPRSLYRSDAADGSDWKARIHHNDISGFGIQDWDQGGIYSAHGPSRYLRIDHNWIHDTHEHVDDLPGARAFTASGIYPDYANQWLIDHNVIWNVEWGIHLQNEDNKGVPPAGYLVLNNSIAVRTIGGGASRHGPYGVVRNSGARFQDSLIADNVILLTDDSTTFKPIDFESDPAVNRVVVGTVSGEANSIGLTGGTRFPEALVPLSGAAQVAGKATARTVATIAGLHVPPIPDRNADAGAFTAGAKPWLAGHEAWPGRPAKPMPVVQTGSAAAPKPAPSGGQSVAEPADERAGHHLVWLLVIAGCGVLAAVLLLAGRKRANRSRR